MEISHTAESKESEGDIKLCGCGCSRCWSLNWAMPTSKYSRSCTRTERVLPPRGTFVFSTVFRSVYSAQTIEGNTNFFNSKFRFVR